MVYWEFTSDSGWFSLNIPENWSEYDSDDKETYAFFNAINWSGNLRITPFRWSVEVNKEDKAAKLIQSEFTENSNAILIKIGKWDAAFYSEEASDDSLIYYWITGSENNLFACSFTIDKSFLTSDRYTEELKIVEEIIGSIKILN